MENGSIKALYLLGCDPGTFPNGSRIRKAMEKLELLMVQEIFPTEAAQLADVVFPAAAAAEKSGTFTTIDQRVQSFGQAINPPGDAREDWDILAELYNRLTSDGVVRSSAEVAREIEGLMSRPASDEGLGHFRLSALCRVLLRMPAVGCWPVLSCFTAERPPRGRKTTSRWPRPGYLEISGEDAGRLGVGDGATLKVVSDAGSAAATARVNHRLQPGLLFAPSHFRQFNTLLSGSCNLVNVKIEKG